MTAVELRGVTKRFGHHVAVDDLSLEVREGEFLSLLGPSGCGKTTTLRLVAGFERPDAGSIRIGGEDVASLPPYRRPVNTVFQSYALFPHLSVLDNVAYGLKQRGVPRKDRANRAAEMLDVVHLAGVERRKPRQLSGGQQQRVALAGVRRWGAGLRCRRGGAHGGRAFTRRLPAYIVCGGHVNFGYRT